MLIENINKDLHKTTKKVNIVYGTGTDAGKTFTTCKLIKAMNLKFKENFVIKPVISGFDDESYQNSDNYKLLQAFDEDFSIESVKQISRYIFKNPLSPDIASWAEGVDIDFQSIINFCKEWIKRLPNHGKIFIETAGGVCSPISNSLTMRDLSLVLKEYEPYNILVTTPYLGSISHTISALNMLKFDLLIINRFEENFAKSVHNHLPYRIEIINLF